MSSTLARSATTDEVMHAMGTLDAAGDSVRRDTGASVSPEHEYALLALMRRLRALVGNEAVVLAGNVRDAALRALEAPNPAPALVSLELAYASLRSLLHQLSGFGMPRPA